MSAVLGIDPGMRKAGYALVLQDGSVAERGIEAVDDLFAAMSLLVERNRVDVLAMGGGTNAARVTAYLAPLGLPVYLVDERETTLHARRLYYAENKPTGLQRLLPSGLRFPPRPIDDYAAEIIARRWLARKGKRQGPS